MPRAALGEKGLENLYFAISRPLGSAERKHIMYKKIAIPGRNFWGGRIFSPKVPRAPGNCVLFSSRVLNFSQCPRPRTGQNPSNSPFCDHLGVRPEKKLFPRKLWKTITNSLVTLFFRFWDPGCSGARKGPCEASCCLLLLLLLATHASTTRVP